MLLNFCSTSASFPPAFFAFILTFFVFVFHILYTFLHFVPSIFFSLQFFKCFILLHFFKIEFLNPNSLVVAWYEFGTDFNYREHVGRHTHKHAHAWKYNHVSRNPFDKTTYKQKRVPSIVSSFFLFPYTHILAHTHTLILILIYIYIYICMFVWGIRNWFLRSSKCIALIQILK